MLECRETQKKIVLYSTGAHVHFGELHFKKGVQLLERVLTTAMKIIRGLENRSLKGDTIKCSNRKGLLQSRKEQCLLCTHAEKDKK